jgi:hypothetical protein
MLEAVLTALLIGFAAYRLWRLIGQDTITERLREGLDGWALDLVTCPWCLGSWIAFTVTAIVAAVVGLAYPVLVGLAAATVTGILGERG